MLLQMWEEIWKMIMVATNAAFLVSIEWNTKPLPRNTELCQLSSARNTLTGMLSIPIHGVSWESWVRTLDTSLQSLHYKDVLRVRPENAEHVFGPWYHLRGLRNPTLILDFMTLSVMLQYSKKVFPLIMFI